MENNEIKIQVPPGMCIDEENSTFECIKFKPKEELTYKDIARELFRNKSTYWFGHNADIHSSEDGVMINYSDSNNAVSEKQCERLLAINQLMNVAYYFNEIVDKDVNCSKQRFILNIDNDTKQPKVCGDIPNFIKVGIVYFKTRKSAEKAIQILGEETVKLAISL